jgi:opacity protein-like surface antigen
MSSRHVRLVCIPLLVGSFSISANASDWSGPYLGGGVTFREHTVGFPNGTDRLTMDDNTTPGVVELQHTPELEHSGNTIGGHVLGGYLFQKDRLIFGLEGDIEFGTSFNRERTPGIPACENPPVVISGTFGCVGLNTFFSGVRTLGHVRGVVGVELTPTVMGFVTAGLAVGKSPDLIGATGGGIVASSPSSPLIGAATVSRSGLAETIYGYTIGGGIQAKVGNGLIIRGEYVYDQYPGTGIAVGGAGFGGTIGDLTTNSFTSPGDTVDYSSHAIRLAAIYQFNGQSGAESEAAYLSESDWAGFYVGGGLSLARHEVGFPDAINRLTMTNNATLGSLSVMPENTFDGESTGGHFLGGYAFQKGRLVFGAEADIEFGNGFERARTIGGPDCLTPLVNFVELGSGHAECIGSRIFFSEVQTIGHIRAKAGFEITPSLLGFVAGGLAIGKSPDTYGASIFGAVAVPPNSPLLGAATVSRSGLSETIYGFTIGGGLEMKASSKLRLRTEYLYDHYKSVDIAVGGAGFGGTIGDITTNSFVSPGTTVDLSSHMVRLSMIAQF